MTNNPLQRRETQLSLLGAAVAMLGASGVLAQTIEPEQMTGIGEFFKARASRPQLCGRSSRGSRRKIMSTRQVELPKKYHQAKEAAVKAKHQAMVYLATTRDAVSGWLVGPTDDLAKDPLAQEFRRRTLLAAAEEVAD